MPSTKTCPICKKEFTTPKKDQVTCGLHCAALLRMAHTPGGRKAGTKAFKRADLNLYLRSSWESNYCRYLNLLIERGEIVSWEYEPKIFHYPLKRGNIHYTPDFKVHVTEEDYEWHEIKGYMDDNSRVKIKRFAKYYPEESARLVIIDKTRYKEIKDEFAQQIAEWE